MLKEKLNSLMRWARSEDLDFEGLNAQLEAALERIQTGLGRIQAAGDLTAETARQMDALARETRGGHAPAAQAARMAQGEPRLVKAAALSESTLNTQMATLDVALEKVKLLVSRLEEMERERSLEAGTPAPMGDAQLHAERLHGMMEGFSQEVTRRVTERLAADGLKPREGGTAPQPPRFNPGVTLN